MSSVHGSYPMPPEEQLRLLANPPPGFAEALWSAGVRDLQLWLDREGGRLICRMDHEGMELRADLRSLGRLIGTSPWSDVLGVSSAPQHARPPWSGLEPIYEQPPPADGPVLPQRSLGRTGLELTEFGLGTAGIAGLSRDRAMEVLEAAWTGGIRHFDTAPHYGQGRAERHLGDFLRGRAGHVLSSKVGRVLRPGGGDAMPFHEVVDYSRDGVLRSHEHSLARLGVDRIDILYVHDVG